MSAATITKRLDRMERARGFTDDSERASDAQLWRIVRAGYQDVFKIVPTTREGLFALIDYARERADFHAQMAFNAGAATTDGDVFPAAPDVLGAIRDGAAMLLDGVREIVAPDPVFEAIRRERALHAAVAALSSEDEAAIDAASDRHAEAFAAMLTIKPRTAAGLLALVRAIRAGGGQHHGTQEVAEMFDLIGDRLSALMGPHVMRVDLEPVRCEAARIGLLIDQTRKEILRLDEAGAHDERSPLLRQWNAADARCDSLHEAISYTRARTPGGMLAQVAVIYSETDLAAHGTTAAIRERSAGRAKRCLLSVAAALARLHGVDRQGYGAAHYLPGYFDHLAILDRREA